jgi:hypothetical protein
VAPFPVAPTHAEGIKRPEPTNAGSRMQPEEQRSDDEAPARRPAIRRLLGLRSNVDGWFWGAVAGLLVSALVVLWPVLRSPFVGDDVPNSQRSAFLQAAHQSPWSYIRDSIREWVQSQGRFFPVSAIENVYLFDTIHDRVLYKLVQVGAVVVVLALAGILAGLLSRDKWVGVTTAAMVIPTFQLRHWHDPILSFGVLLPSVTIKVLASWCALVLALRSRRRSVTVGLLAVASISWTAALLQYEVVYLLSPFAALIAWAAATRGWRLRVAAIAAVTAPALVCGMYVASLGQGSAPSAAYALRLDTAYIAPALIHQTVGAVPMSVAVLRGAGAPGVATSLSQSVGWGLVACTLTFGVLAISFRRIGRLERRGVVAMFGLGVALFVLPALPIAVSAGRQDDLTWGLAYLPVFIQGVGFGLAAGSLFALGRAGVRRLQSGRPSVWFAAVSWSVAMSMFAVVGLTVATASSGNRWATDQYMPLRNWQEAFDAAIRDGLLDDLPPESIITSPTADGWFWSNGPYVRWRGGPVLTFVQQVPDGSAPCEGEGGAWCDSEGRQIHQLRAVLVGDDLFAFALAPVTGRTADPLDPLVDVGRAVFFGPAAEPPRCAIDPTDASADASLGATSKWMFSRCDPGAGAGPVAASALVAQFFPPS